MGPGGASRVLLKVENDQKDMVFYTRNGLSLDDLEFFEATT
jgi:hypothetical protein